MNIVTFNKESSILTEKYAPTNISEIIGSPRQVDAISLWLDNFRQNRIECLSRMKQKKGKKKKKVTKNDDADDDDGEDNGSDEIDQPRYNMTKDKKKDPNMYSCLILTGDHGCGKTSIVRAILNDKGYQIKSINFNKIGTIKRIDDFVENLLFGDNVYDVIQGKGRSKFAVVIDEIESISTLTEKAIVNSVLKINSEKWTCPVFFIANRDHKKIINDVKKESYHLCIYEPSNINMMTLLKKIGVGEGMKMQDVGVADDIIRHSQHDFRRMILILQELKRLYGNQIITKKTLAEYIKYSDEKDVDYTIYENTSKLFSEYTSIGNALRIFEGDKINMPLMVQQNHFKAMSEYIVDKKKKIEYSSDIAESVAMGDIIDNYIYSEQSWNLQEMHGFYTCVYPSYVLNKNIDTKKLSSDSVSLFYDTKLKRYVGKFMAEYPKDLNRTSTKRINYKNVKLANQYFNNMTISDYIYAVELIKKLLEDNRLNKYREIMKEYNVTPNGLLYVLKIDKINGTKKDIPKVMEKRIKEISSEVADPEPVKIIKTTRTKNQ
ncbi:MAG: replication factor C large subunit [Dasosvirus sp.]|uniref:Replication factor C large subunit n=1 Tax=Dasosvirus sp. TaxID=2487764 RepID=A0A3G4ZRA0_9VIRU|nr:MAG: replication factor C large subunit [Dasosvirus sp.]